MRQCHVAPGLYSAGRAESLGFPPSLYKVNMSSSFLFLASPQPCASIMCVCVLYCASIWRLRSLQLFSRSGRLLRSSVPRHGWSCPDSSCTQARNIIAGLSHGCMTYLPRRISRNKANLPETLDSGLSCKSSPVYAASCIPFAETTPRRRSLPAILAFLPPIGA